MYYFGFILLYKGFSLFTILDIKKEGNPLLTNLILPSHLDTGC